MADEAGSNVVELMTALGSIGALSNLAAFGGARAMK